MQYKELGVFIRKKRNEHNVSLNGFAFSNDIVPAILSRIENLKQDIKFSVLVKIAKGFNMSPAQFLAEFEAYIEK